MRLLTVSDGGHSFAVGLAACRQDSVESRGRGNHRGTDGERIGAGALEARDGQMWDLRVGRFGWPCRQEVGERPPYELGPAPVAFSHLNGSVLVEGCEVALGKSGR